MNKQDENLLGMLLVFPLFLLVILIFRTIDVVINYPLFKYLDNTILMGLLIHIPILIGVIIENNVYKEKLKRTFKGIDVIIFDILSFIFYYDTYFVEHSGWGGLGSFFYWLITLFITYILSARFYSKAVGSKKATAFALLYPVFYGVFFLLIVLFYNIVH